MSSTCNLYDCNGIDWDGPAVIDNHINVVNVLITCVPLNLHDIITVTNQVDPLKDSEDAWLTIVVRYSTLFYTCMYITFLEVTYIRTYYNHKN